MNSDNIINNVLINNTYNIINNEHNDDFHIAIYYLSDNKCSITIRRLDCNSWEQNLKIRIMDIDNRKYENISLGSSEDNIKKIDYYTKIQLFPTIYEENRIPKVIIQTSNYKNNKNLKHYNAIMSIIEMNPEYDYKFFDDNDARKFISDNFKKNILDENLNLDESLNSNLDKKDDESFEKKYLLSDILIAYDMLIPGSYRADLFRYCYLYINGGCYIDCKMIMKKSLSKIIDKDDSLIVCLEDYKFYNGLIFTEKNNKLIYNCIKDCVTNILNNKDSNNPDNVTGNYVFYNNLSSCENISKKLVKREKSIYFASEINSVEENILFRTEYKDYTLDDDNNFRFLWNNKKYIFKQGLLIGKYKFYFYPNSCNDTFDIINLKHNIFLIKRTDTNTGWGQFVKLKVIDIESSIIYNINIDNSEENEKVFIVDK
jgi:hypothetical protein